MLVIAHQEGFTDLASFRASLKTNPKYMPTSADQILDDFRRYIAQMQPKLPELFTYIPGSPVTVEAIPDFQSAMATHYQTGTPDGKRPGRVVVATSNFAHRSADRRRGHRLSRGHSRPSHAAVGRAAADRPAASSANTAGNSGYVEGWALYAEQLGKEVGFYQDPV